MPFDELETVTKENATPQATISYMRFRRKGDVHDPDTKPRLTIWLPTSAYLCRKKRAYIQVGHGEDAGKVRIVGTEDAKKGVKVTDMRKLVRLNFGYVPALKDEIFDGVKCDIVRIADDIYELTPPPSLFKDAAVETLRANVRKKASA